MEVVEIRLRVLLAKLAAYIRKEVAYQIHLQNMKFDIMLFIEVLKSILKLKNKFVSTSQTIWNS